MRRGRVVMLVLVGALALASGASAQVLRVGTYHGVRGQFSSIQAAVNAAKPDDWILVGPGDYKTRSSRRPKGRSDLPAGVLMTTPDVYLRGMNRNTVIVDGTKPGSPKCSAQPADQNFGPSSAKGRLGLNGIMVWKAADVWVQNLTACNFLGGSGGDGQTGNEIWWNGGSDSAKVGGHGYYGSYLTTTSTFFRGETTAAEYGIFSSNWSGGTWDQTYASNFNDSGLYIGACQQVCDQVIDHAHAEYNALGYSGTRSSTRTRTGSTPTLRTATNPHPRTAPVRTTASARSRTRTPAGCSCTTTCTTTTTRTSPRPETRRRARWVRA